MDGQVWYRWRTKVKKAVFYRDSPGKCLLKWGACVCVCLRLQRSNSTGTARASTFDGSALLKQSNVQSSSSAIMSSAELLARMRSQNTLIPSSASNRDDDNVNVDTVPVNTDPQVAELLRDIRDFVACGSSVDGQATTKEIIEHFRTRVSSELTAKFKALLKQVCVLEKIDGVGVWKLKEDFQ